VLVVVESCRRSSAQAGLGDQVEAKLLYCCAWKLAAAKDVRLHTYYFVKQELAAYILTNLLKAAAGSLWSGSLFCKVFHPKELRTINPSLIESSLDSSFPTCVVSTNAMRSALKEAFNFRTSNLYRCFFTLSSNVT
jgi:hypothetical protein